MKFIFFAIFLHFQVAIKPPIQVCKTDMIMTYNITPYRKPVRLKYNICPYMTNTCCSLYDQYEIYNVWQNQTKHVLERAYDEIGKKLILLEKMIKFIMKVKWRKLLKKVKVSKRKRLHLYKILLITLSQNLPKNISSALFLQREVAEYFMKLRSQFFCQICEGKNQFFFKPKKKEIIISYGSCLQLAENTIDYAFLMYRRIYFNLSRFSQVLKEFSADQIPRLLVYPSLKRKVKNVFNCYQKKNPDGTIEQGCRKFCGYYTHNSISPEMEGDIIYLDKTIHYIAKFIRENYTLMPQVGRILEKRDFIYHKTKEIFAKQPRPVPDFYAKPTGMTDDEVKEIFKSDGIQQTQESLEIFAKSYLSYFDPKLDFGVGNPWKIFDFKSFNQVDLENYTTKIGNRGIDLFNKPFQLQDLKINKPIMDIVEGIKNKKADEIPNEVLDEKLIRQLNSIGDKYLKKFHADLFMYFNPNLQESADVKQAVEKVKEMKEKIQKEEKIELPPMTKEEEKSTVAQTTDKITEKTAQTIESVKNFPNETQVYMKETIDDLQYGKRSTI